MRTLCSFLVAAVIAAAFFVSCKKDFLNAAQIPNTESTNKPPSNGEGVGSKTLGDPSDKIVILGQPQSIPYSVTIVTQAWNELTGQTLSTIAPTHQYVRFLPQNLDELATLLELEDSDDLDFDVYPLHFEVLQEGEFYQDPSIPDGEITWHYTTVPIGFSFPAVQYEILEELINVPYISHLTKRAYEIASIPYDDSWIGGGGGEDPIDCTPLCTNWPCCYVEGIPCEDPEQPLCDCFPGTPNWPECLGPDDGGYDPDPPVNLNACGCQIPIHPRYPAGCIQVVDTQIDPEPGVRQVKVVVKNNPFFSRSTTTDDKGCWRINHKHAGKVRVKVKFKNAKCRIRAIREWGESLWQYAIVLIDHNIYYGPTYNQIEILYVQNTNQNSVGRALWYGPLGTTPFLSTMLLHKVTGSLLQMMGLSYYLHQAIAVKLHPC